MHLWFVGLNYSCHHGVIKSHSSHPESVQVIGGLRAISGTCILYHFSTLSLPQKYDKNQYNPCSAPTISVQFSHSVVSDSLWPHELQHARPPCPSPTPGVYPNSCPLSRWCHPTISSSVGPFSSHRQSFPASGSSPMSQFFASGGQTIGVSALASVLPMNIQDWFPLGSTGWISLWYPHYGRVIFSAFHYGRMIFSAITASISISMPWRENFKANRTISYW